MCCKVTKGSTPARTSPLASLASTAFCGVTSGRMLRNAHRCFHPEESANVFGQIISKQSRKVASELQPAQVRAAKPQAIPTLCNSAWSTGACSSAEDMMIVGSHRSYLPSAIYGRLYARAKEVFGAEKSP